MHFQTFHRTLVYTTCVEVGIRSLTTGVHPAALLHFANVLSTSVPDVCTLRITSPLVSGIFAALPIWSKMTKAGMPETP